MLNLQLDSGALRDIINDAVAAAYARQSAAAQTPEWLTLRKAARYLDCSESTVRTWVDAGDLPAHQWGRIVRVKRSDLDALLAAKAPAQ